MPTQLHLAIHLALRARGYAERGYAHGAVTFTRRRGSRYRPVGEGRVFLFDSGRTLCGARIAEALELDSATRIALLEEGRALLPKYQVGAIHIGDPT